MQNASEYPKIFYCRHMEPGIAKQPDGVYLTDRDCMKNMLPSFVGKPVFVHHVDNVDLKNIKQQADGYVTEAFYNEMDGWGWAKFIAVDDKAHEAIKKGWAVSNAYQPTQMGPGGTKNNCPYKAEVKDGFFTHLAIVPDPRYEGAMILNPEEFKNYQEEQRKKLAEMKNSKEKRPMFKLFKNKKEEVTGADIDLDTHLELENGKSLSIREMVNAVVDNSKKQDQLIDVGGKKMTVADLVAAYAELQNGKKKMKNNDDKEKSEGEEGDDDDKEEETSQDKKEKKNKKSMKKNSDKEKDDCMENSDEDEAEKDEEKETKKEKKNSVNDIEKNDKFFTEMRNAHTKAFAEPHSLMDTPQDQLKRGQQRYGSTPAKKSA